MRCFLLVLFLAAVVFLQSISDAIEKKPITMDYFGLHIHRSDQGTAWPKVPFGSWRLWDAYVGWAYLEPEQGKWDFKRLDKYVAMAKLTKTDILLPLAMTPTWASARPNEPSGYNKLGSKAEPARIEDWMHYVETIGNRYKGRIRYYEIWNEPSDQLYFTGNIETLVDLTCKAYKILKHIDPANRIVSPASTGGGRHIEYLDRFLQSGGKDCIDIVAHHFYVPRFGPEAMVPLIRSVRAVMQKHNIENKPLWNTETGWWLANGDGTPDHPMVAKGGWRKVGLEDAASYLFRAFLLARAEGVDRFYWYSWDNRYGLGMIEPSSGKEKPIVEGWRSMAKQLLGSTIESCSGNVNKWTCLTSDSSGKKREITWIAE
ncbi:MAG: hypothetical protein EPN22_16065 [Nitrospirae bacterium]|nr:MAG: hypothetical protein EPN22_16065 [Nitrospirota bacterium]